MIVFKEVGQILGKKLLLEATDFCKIKAILVVEFILCL